MKETSPGCYAAHNLARRGKNMGAKISLMEKVSLEVVRGCSRYNTITKLPREEIA